MTLATIITFFLSGLWAVLASALKEELHEQFAVGRLEDQFMILFSCKNRFLKKKVSYLLWEGCRQHTLFFLDAKIDFIEY